MDAVSRATLTLPAHQDLGETETEPGRQPPGTALQKQEGRGQRCAHTAHRQTQSTQHDRGRPQTGDRGHVPASLTSGLRATWTPPACVKSLLL